MSGTPSLVTNRAGNPLAILMVSSGYPPAHRAGLEYGCQRLSEGLARRGHPVTVLTSHVPGAAADTIERGVRVLRVLKPIGFGPLWGWNYRRQVRRRLIDLLPHWDVVMCHQLYLHSPEANRIARAHGRHACHLLVAAQEYSDVSRLASVRGGARLLRDAVDLADGLFVLSAHSRRELEAVGTPADRIHPYRYFVDIDRFSPDDAADAAAPAPALAHARERELLCLGRWHAQKNLPLLLDAFERFSARVPDVRLRIIGAGEEEARLREGVARLSHPDRVSVEGWAEDPRAAYRRAWALVTSSDAEGLSNVMIEALASGTPVVTTDVSGAREALDLEDLRAHPGQATAWLRGTGGLLAPLRDAIALASAMTAICETPGLRDTLSREARARAISTFSEEAGVGLFLDAVRQWLPPPAGDRPESIGPRGMRTSKRP